MEARWGMKERIDQSRVGKCIRWCIKIKGKSTDFLGIGEDDSKETEGVSVILSVAWAFGGVHSTFVPTRGY